MAQSMTDNRATRLARLKAYIAENAAEELRLNALIESPDPSAEEKYRAVLALAKIVNETNRLAGELFNAPD